MKRNGVSRERALRELKRRKDVKMFKRILSKFDLSGDLFDVGADFSTPSKRLLKVDSIFNYMINKCDNWRELRQSILSYNGFSSNEISKIEVNVMDLYWPVGLLVLLFDYVLEFELLRILFKNKFLNEDYVFKLFLDVRNEHTNLRRIFMEDIVLQGGEARAKTFLGDVLVRYLEPGNNKNVISYYLVDKSRRFFGSNSSTQEVLLKGLLCIKSKCKIMCIKTHFMTFPTKLVKKSGIFFV